MPHAIGDRAHVGHAITVDVRRDLDVEGALVLDDPREHEPATGEPGDLDRVRGALVGMDASEEQQVLAR